MADKKHKPVPLGPVDQFNDVAQVLGITALARMLHTRRGHLTAFALGEKPLGPRRLERLHVVHEVVSLLHGSGNAFGINAWFDRPRTDLGRVSPRYVLQSYPWREKDKAVKRIKRLARDTAAKPSG